MNIERVYTKDANLSIETIIQAYLHEKIDSMISQDYSGNKVNIATSHDKETEVTA